MRQTFTISDRATLSAARAMTDLDAVTIDTARLKFRNLMPHALKYAFWAVRPGGTITISDDGGRDAAPPAYGLSFNFIRQWAFKFIGAGCEVESFDANGRMVLRRTAPILAPGWSAGVVFSGNDGEIPVLEKCLDGLAKQSELSEIMVCGPARDLGFLAAYPQVHYLAYETPPGPRFLIGQKKNALMAALDGPRMVILHARVVLDEGALAHAPREFDMSGPATRVATAAGERPYLSLIQADTAWPGSSARRQVGLLRDVASGDPLELVERGPVFVDGGGFYVTKPLFDVCPLHGLIAWEEGEDIEWCARAFHQGFLIDIAPESGAVSQTSKLRDWSKLGPFEAPARAASTFAKTRKAATRDMMLRLLGHR